MGHALDFEEDLDVPEGDWWYEDWGWVYEQIGTVRFLVEGGNGGTFPFCRNARAVQLCQTWEDREEKRATRVPCPRTGRWGNH